MAETQSLGTYIASFARHERERRLRYRAFFMNLGRFRPWYRAEDAALAHLWEQNFWPFRSARKMCPQSGQGHVQICQGSASLRSSTA